MSDVNVLRIGQQVSRRQSAKITKRNRQKKKKRKEKKVYDGISGLIFPPYKSGAVIFVVNSCRFCSQSINANKSLLPPPFQLADRSEMFV